MGMKCTYGENKKEVHMRLIEYLAKIACPLSSWV
jgi:hypothetical protein